MSTYWKYFTKKSESKKVVKKQNLLQFSSCFFIFRVFRQLLSCVQLFRTIFWINPFSSEWKYVWTIEKNWDDFDHFWGLKRHFLRLLGNVVSGYKKPNCKLPPVPLGRYHFFVDCGLWIVDWNCQSLLWIGFEISRLK